MANNRCVYQQERTVSVPKHSLLEWIAYNEKLGKKDLRVFIMLLTELDGYEPPKKGNAIDPHNFRMIDEERIADKLDLKRKEVRESISTLKKCGIIERGDSNSGTNGWRFTF